MKLLLFAAIIAAISQLRAVKSFALNRVPFSTSSSSSLTWRRQGSTQLFAKLWERLQIEEDAEPNWYLLNCVAGLEMDLLRQCRTVCANMPDAIKFVVPTEKKTRSHGANKMVTETKVKYLGYVFAKLRLCEDVYEAIQSLDLCRSWMGTPNRKGNRKLPPVPVPLNEMEIENFGLEKVEVNEFDDELAEAGGDDGIIVDEDVEEEKVDKDALKVYLGLKVEDMIKVTAKGKFFNEDGIVRRLKEGKILVRFYTYGTMYEEWIQPGDVRKLSGDEILRGLSGPSKPITQQEFDGPGRPFDGQRQYGRSADGPREYGRQGDMRRNPMSMRNAPGNLRDRRQDRPERRYKDDFFGRSDEERRRDERNWNWYQDQKQQERRGRNTVTDGDWRIQAGSRPNGRGRDDSALGDVDSQWGRRKERPQQSENRRQNNRRTTAALDGANDWSAYVSKPVTGTADAAASNEADDFFSSLMNDLSKDLDTKGGRSSRESDSRPQNPASSTNEEDDFFASLMQELSDESATSTATEVRSPRKKSVKSVKSEKNSNLAEDDFFASLEAELGSDTTKERGSKRNSADGESSMDDFFAQLEAELNPPIESKKMEPTDAKEMKGDTEDAPKTRKRTSSAKVGASTPPSLNPEKLNSYTVPELKELLREKGLKVTGKKAELIERLLH